MDLWKLLIYFLTLRWLFGSSAASSPTAFGGEPACDDRNHNGICDEEEKNAPVSDSSHFDHIMIPSPVLPAWESLASSDTMFSSAYQTEPLAATQAQPDISFPSPSSDSVNVHIHDEITPEKELPEYWYNDDDELEEVDPFEEYKDCHEEDEAEEDEGTPDNFGFFDSDEDDSSWSGSFDNEQA